MANKSTSPGNALNQLARYLADRPRSAPKMVGDSGPTGNDLDTRLRWLPIPLGDIGDILKIIDEGGDIVPAWEPGSGSGSGFQYRDYTYATYGGGYFLFDSTGDAIYTLRDLE